LTRPLRPLITCEHGGNRVPDRWAGLFHQAGAVLEGHRGWDRGALPLARYLAGGLPAPLRFSLTTRLLVDPNRSAGSPDLFAEFSGKLPSGERSILLRRYHDRHWRRVIGVVERMIAEGGRVGHIGVHTFSPVLDGRVRDVDVGVLFDPERRREKRLAEGWMRELRERLPHLSVQANQPYRGIDDGLPTSLRARFPADRYLGLELEVKQGPLVDSGPQGRRIRHVLLDALRSVIAGD